MGIVVVFFVTNGNFLKFLLSLSSRFFKKMQCCRAVLLQKLSSSESLGLKIASCSNSTFMRTSLFYRRSGMASVRTFSERHPAENMREYCLAFSGLDV